ncbi:MAG: hypothetical protein AAGA55_01870 [Planctomycetota bacterium]
MTPAPGERVGRPVARWAAWAGFMLGLALLAGAVWLVLARDPEALSDVWSRLRAAPFWAAAVIVLGPLVNWIIVSGCLWMLLVRHGRVGWGEMNALVGSAWLLNHLPMRPGLIGRVGYHKIVNGIRVRDAIESTVWSLVLAALAGVMALALAFAVAPEHGVGQVGLVLAGPVLVLAAIGMCVRVAGRTGSALLLGALAARYADLAVWAARYAVVFWLMGLEIAPVQIIVITGVSQVAQLIPIAGGGLGVREWMVAFAAGWFADTSLPADHAGMREVFDAALSADLINRAAETLIVIPVGLIGSWVVARNLRRLRGAASPNAGEQLA